MATVLVVGSRTLTSPELLRAVQDRAADDHAVHVVVPAVLLRRADVQLAHSEGLAGDGGESVHVAVARWRLRRALQHFSDAGLEVEGHVGDADEVEAVVAAVAAVAPGVVVISTLPRKRSQWLARDLPTKIRARVDIPVEVVVTNG